MLRALALLPTVALSACMALPPGASGPGPVAALLLGEQHDAGEHHQLQKDVVEALADRRLLAAVVLEMAEAGRTTVNLPAAASERQVREALAWNNDAWPWEMYGPAVMTAVRAGVPVIGANLAPAQMRAATTDLQLDTALPATALRTQREAIRSGHCDLLPEAQLPAMTRVQIARDRAMARAVSAAVVPGKTVVLLAGAGHVDPGVGVPLHLSRGLRVESVVLPPVGSGKDSCAEMRSHMQRQKG